MSDLREFPMGEALHLLVGPVDVIAANLRRVQDIEEEIQRLVERLQALDREDAES